MKKTYFSTLVFLSLVHSASAVVVSSASPNITAPIGQPFFDHVGIINGASGIYLGDRWMITAAHVAGSLPGSSISLAGGSYSAQSGTFQRVPNPTGFGFSALTDLAVFRLTTDPGLPSLEIPASAPAIGADLMMIGRGRDPQSSRTYWDVTVNAGANNDVWTVVAEGGHDREGYQTLSSQTIRWGENDVDAINLLATYNVGPTSTDVVGFTTSFDLIGKTHEAQGVVGDSGGAVFVDVAGTWKLAGVMLAVSTLEQQPENTAVFGNETFSADLSFYRSEIFKIIPEPSSVLLGALGSFMLLARRKR